MLRLRLLCFGTGWCGPAVAGGASKLLLTGWLDWYINQLQLSPASPARYGAPSAHTLAAALQSAGACWGGHAGWPVPLSRPCTPAVWGDLLLLGSSASGRPWPCTCVCGCGCLFAPADVDACNRQPEWYSKRCNKNGGCGEEGTAANCSDH